MLPKNKNTEKAKKFTKKIFKKLQKTLAFSCAMVYNNKALKK